jgi:hypothetical protein
MLGEYNMLNNIINKVAEKVGISTEKATAAVTIVVDILKNKLPAPIASQIDNILNGGSASDVVDKTKDAASDLMGSVKEKIGSIFNKK